MMKATQLRQAILQAAVQGKLVPQDSHDEPASVLLERIRAKKSKLIKEGKLKKEKNLSPITEDEIYYDLPEGWMWCRLGDVCITNPRNHLSDNSEVTFTPMALISSHFSGGHGNEMRLWKDVKSGFTHYAENDIAIAKITPCFQNGKSCVMRNLRNGHGAGTTELHILRTIQLAPEYLLLFVKHPRFLIEGEKNMTGTAGQQRVPTEYLRNFLFSLPPLEEQRRIVAKVNELMAMCDELEAVEKASDALDKHFMEYLPKSILQAAVRGRLVPQNPSDEPASILLERIRAEKAKLIKAGKLKKEKPLPPITADEIPYDLPDGWLWCRLGEISNYGRNDIYDPAKIPSDSWLLELEDIEKETGRIFKTVLKRDRPTKSTKYAFSKGQVLLGKLRPYLNKVLVAPADGFCSSEILPLSFGEINPSYSAILLRSPFFVDYATSKSYGVKMPRLGTTDGVMALFPLPPLAEQQRIVAKVDELMALCAKLKTVAENVEMSEAKQATIIPLGRPQENEPLRMVARGKVNKEVSEARRKARDDMFNDD